MEDDHFINSVYKFRLKQPLHLFHDAFLHKLIVFLLIIYRQEP